MAVKWGVDIPTTARQGTNMQISSNSPRVADFGPDRTPEEWAKEKQPLPWLEVLLRVTQYGGRGWVLTPFRISGVCPLAWISVSTLTISECYKDGCNPGWYVYDTMSDEEYGNHV